MALKWQDLIKRASDGNPAPARRVEKTDAEWKAQLSPESYQVARQSGTERPFGSDMCGLFEPGEYACICCDTLLFSSAQKYDSGTGWPSFGQPVEPDVIAYHVDNSAGSTRIETTCNVCDAHLGHVFPDGPEPTGLRYCMNAVALSKVKEDAAAGGN